jgi:hypothetical protein
MNPGRIIQKARTNASYFDPVDPTLMNSLQPSSGDALNEFSTAVFSAVFLAFPGLRQRNAGLLPQWHQLFFAAEPTGPRQSFSPLSRRKRNSYWQTNRA